MIPEPASFRDPSGFVFYAGDDVFRQVNLCYREHYDLLMGSGLYERLVTDGLLIRHEETTAVEPRGDRAYKVLAPERIPFVSYPYEWCFGQLKAAALRTLRAQMLALDYGMSLKDSSAYNVQFFDGRPVLIDTLSFERYKEGRPWVAYRQFCQHFLAPLALMAYRDPGLGLLLRLHIDGVPLELASRLLPKRSWLRYSILSNIHLHARTQKAFSDRKTPEAKSSDQRGVSLNRLKALVETLISGVRGISLPDVSTHWSGYYEETNYVEEALTRKAEIVQRFVEEAAPGSVWDVGANTGRFSRIASDQGIFTVSMDLDYLCVEQNYLRMKAEGSENLLPLVMDLTNPSSAIGWENRERRSLAERGPADLVMGLALVHHLAIGNNVPLQRTASFLRSIGRALVIEFVPKSDSQVQRMLASREDVFPDYTQTQFEQAFSASFDILRREPLPQCERTLYLMRAKADS